jgi:hypothetical protein
MYAIITKDTNETLALCTTVDRVEAILPLFHGYDVKIRWQAE